MVRLKSFETLLQQRVALEDQSWSYNVPNLPNAQTTNQAKLVKSIALPSANTTNQGIRLRLVDAPSNRVTWSEPLDRFILLAVEGFKFEVPSSAPDAEPQYSTSKESSEYVCRLLVSGIRINGQQYYFFGHSNSQLKSRSCFLYAASKEEIARKIEAMGDFSKLKSVAKKAKRIGLLFSSAEMGVNLSPEHCQDIEDVERGDFNFTDGCGLISKVLAHQLVRGQNIAFRNRRYLPSVFQIRYRGYKGVLTLDPSLKGSIAAQFRKSMKKFQDAKDLTLSVVDCSKPYAFGYLNDEVVLLLSALGVSTETFLQKQSEYLQFLSDVTNGQLREAFRFLSFCNRMDVAEKLLLDGFGAARATIRSLVKQEYDRMINKRDEQRCRIFLPKSRLLFGICDPTSKDGHSGQLKEGCCFVRITNDEDGEVRTLLDAEVLVTRNPCLHPGDLQKFRLVDIPEFSHLVDCIVFPTQGRRPSADLMSGGDLDGDKFLVTWDEDIVPSTISQPAEYPGVKEPITFKAISDDDRAEYFAKYTNASLGRVKNLYLKWARLKGSMSSECQQLNRLFSQCVDGNRIKVPPTLEDPKEPQSDTAPFVLDVLHDAAKKNIMEASVSHGNFDYFPHTMLNALLGDDSIAASEFELVKLTLQWCHQNHFDFKDFMHHFNYSKLSDEQQAWLLNYLPPSPETPKLVRNGLLQSSFVSPMELRSFKLDRADLHWRPIFDSSTDRMGRFLHVACQSLELFHKKLIILKVDERLTVMIYVPQKIDKASEVQVDGTVRVFALPCSQGLDSPKYCVVPTKVNYRLYCDESVFQLYENKRANTWVFLTRGAMDDSSYRSIPRAGDRRRAKQETVEQSINFDCRASIALQKFSKGIQTHLGRLNRAGILGAEIYVISNRDTRSMRVLDLWLHYIDTEETLPLFEEQPVEYILPKLQSLDLDSYSPSVVQIIRNRDISKIRLLGSLREVEECLHLLLTYNENVLLREAYVFLLTTNLAEHSPISQPDLVRGLLQLLPEAPHLVDLFFRSPAWASIKPDIQTEFRVIADLLLKQLILSANTLRHFIQRPLQILLGELKLLSLQSLANTIELVSLAVRDAETALNILLEIIEPETSRLLVGHPKASQQCVKGLIGVALDHIDEAASNRKTTGEPLHLVSNGEKEGFAVVQATIRIDSPLNGLLKKDDHVRLTVPNPPENSPLTKPPSMDALVLRSEPGEAYFRCIQQPPSYFQDCTWELTHCGSFVTTKTMFDALSTFYKDKMQCCRLYDPLVGLKATLSSISTVDCGFSAQQNLNTSQNRALEAAMTSPLTFLWGPPGTGKTHTIVVILVQLLKALPEHRVLVAAPTHNAVDNILQKFIDEGGISSAGVEPLRVSTSVNKVASALRSFTCDAMVGKDLNANMAARSKAQKRVKESRLIFSTCAGAGLGLLRTEKFEVVLVDEASQQTEPETLIPLVKGCRRAVFVGDHVQLRATVQKTAVVVGYDVSLFERHYDMPPQQGVAKVMLNMQYRMHADVCAFSSSEFYRGELQTAVADTSRPLIPSKFPWPPSGRKVFIQCPTTEDIGHQSKANRGQAMLCRRVCEFLCTAVATDGTAESPRAYTPSQIAVLTPYTRQKELLKSILPAYDVSSIDGYQGREANIVIFVTVRSNVHYELGFLTDLRRLNVAMTRARTAVIVIGDRATLTGVTPGETADESKKCWTRLLQQCVEIDLPIDTMDGPKVDQDDDLSQKKRKERR